MKGTVVSGELVSPTGKERLARGRALLVVATCLSVLAAYAALILVWFITGDLDWESLVVWCVLAALLGGLSVLAHQGRALLALLCLVTLLMLLVGADVLAYGVGEPGAAGFAIPIVLAASGLGLWAGLGVAGAACVVVWLAAVGEMAGWYAGIGAPVESHLTFNAPAYTVILVLIALMIGLWSQYWMQSASDPDRGA